MTDHSTARALVERLRKSHGIMPAACPLIEEAADFIEQTLTPPEGDTLSGEVVEARQAAWQFFDGLDGPLQAAFGALSDDDKSEAVDQLEAALQSRVSPK